MGLEVIPVTSTTNKITVISKSSRVTPPLLLSHFDSPNMSLSPKKVIQYRVTV